MKTVFLKNGKSAALATAIASIASIMAIASVSLASCGSSAQAVAPSAVRSAQAEETASNQKVLDLSNRGLGEMASNRKVLGLSNRGLAEETASNQKVLDWSNRGLGEMASPSWLLPALRGNWKPFKEEWPVNSNKILKIGAAQAAQLNSAQTIADVQYAARLASQLKQMVLTRAAISLGSDGEFETVQDAATKTMVNMAGQERLTDFWQKIEVKENGKKNTYYVYYVVYACDSAVWDQLVAKYLFDIVGQLPDKKTQQTIAAMFNEIDAETKSEKEKTEAQFKADIAAQQAAIRQTAPQTTAEVRAAYKSGDSAKIAAASTTKADVDYVAALALAARN
jgi:hypothetical protein